MASALYRRFGVFRAEIDRLIALYAEIEPCVDVLPALFESIDLADTRLAQPAIYIVSRALERFWAAMGVTPDAVVGHSVGEFVAAATAGIISDADALRFLAARAAAMAGAPLGAMLAVRASEAEARAFALPGLDLAAVNSPRACVLSGPVGAIEDAEHVLREWGVAARRLGADRAFHSAAMEPVVEILRATAEALTLRAPLIAFASTVTGRLERDAPTDPTYWARHCRVPVRFLEGIDAAVSESSIVLEVGPGRTLAALAAQSLASPRLRFAIASLAGDPEDDVRSLLEAAGRLWRAGAPVELSPILSPDARRRAGLPLYPFSRERCWIDAPAAQSLATPILSEAPVVLKAPAMPQNVTTAASTDLAGELSSVLASLLGAPIPSDALGATFLELGCDSLLLGQFSTKIDQRFGVRVPFRRLLRELPTLKALADYVGAEGGVARVAPPPTPTAPLNAPTPMSPVAAGDVSAVFQAQLDAMNALIAQQNAVLASGAYASATRITAELPAVPMIAPPSAPASERPRFKPYNPQAAPGDGLAPEHAVVVADLSARWSAKTPSSKAYAERHRATLADPRSVSGFRPEWKELVYPVVAARAAGSKIVDLDGNVYIDLVNGYGQTAFGHTPSFVREALARQTEIGFAIGPQSPLAGEVAEEIAAMVGMERVTFCNTGSEAVMAAMRVARCVTGRDKVVVFANDYHGQFDEVLVRPRAGAPGALPLAPGIPQRAVDDMIVLPYGAAASLDWIRANARDLAAIVVEPVQSRHPELLPFEFLRALRDVASDAGAALVFDEVVTGFRTHIGGMQAVLGLRADLATYGKVLGGGMPVGVLAGSRRFMDALDGGAWRFGDDSAPETSPTFFAGTFVRHPLVLAACKATLAHMREQGAALQETLTATTADLVERLRDVVREHAAPVRLETYSSWFMIEPAREETLAPLLFAAMRLNGVHTQDGFPCFLTTAHDAADIDAIVSAFSASLVDCGFSRTVAAVRTSAKKSAPLTEPQKEILFASALGGVAAAAFIESVRIDLEGALDVARFERVFNEMIARHDALRVRIDREALMMEAADELPMLAHIDLSVNPDPNAALAAAIEHDTKTPFDFATGPLARAVLYTLSTDHAVLVFSAHHIVCDGWSIGAILNDLASLYVGETQPKSRSFFDYAAQVKAPQAATLAHWRTSFAEQPEPLILPADRPHAARAFNGATVTEHIDAALVASFKRLCAHRGATLFVGLLSATSILLSRLSGAGEVVIGAPVARQAASEAHEIVGHMVDFLPLRVKVDRDQSFAALLAVTGAVADAALDHADISYGEICRTLGVVRDARRAPLMSVQFNLERFADGLCADGVSMRLTPNPKTGAVFDAFFNMIESANGLRIDVDYDSDRFDGATIQRWVDNFRTVLRAAIEDAESRTIAAMPFLGEDERIVLLRRAQTAPSEGADQTICAAFQAIARARPNAIAVEQDEQALTYDELDRQSDAVAKCLLGRGVCAGDVVALLAERGADAIVGMLGIVKSGASFAPFEPKTPVARLEAMLRDCGARIALTTSTEHSDLVCVSLQAAVEDGGALGGVPQGPLSAAASAAIMYTSGSSGMPKGVIVPHRAIVGLVTDQNYARFASDETWLQAAPLAFDASTLEIWGALLHGGRVVVDTADPLTLDGLARTIRDKKITSAWLTAALFHVVVDERIEALAPLRQIIAGGDVLSPSHVRRLMTRYPDLRIVNGYGPTENTTFTACYDVREGDWTDEAVPIGAPIRGCRAYVLDDRHALAPFGAVGELAVGGEGLADGYLGDDARTRERFVELGGGVGERVYLTGDLVRWRPDGRLAYIGRRDAQVKVNGLRIELGEVEAILRAQEGVAEAAVMAHKDGLGGARLDAVVSIGSECAETDSVLTARLRQALAARLPKPAMPRIMLRRGALPQTPQGKIDRKALVASPQLSQARVARALSPMESRIASIWRDVLSVQEIGADDSIFDLGADSLQIFRIAARFAKDALPIEARHMMANPTVAALALMAEGDPRRPPPQKPTISLADFKRTRRPA
jgi:amino acid adenylation domain-containing protein